MVLASRIAVMAEGRIAQVGTPGEVYEYPANRHVASFVGNINLIDGRVTTCEAGRVSLHCPSAQCDRRRALRRARSARRTAICVAVRPEKITISRDAPDARDRNVVKGVVRDLGYFGDQSLYRVRLQSGAVLQVSAQNLRRIGESRRSSGTTKCICRGKWRARSCCAHDDSHHHQWRRYPTLAARARCCVPYAWLLLFFLAPFLIILKISFAEPVVAQPPFTALLEWGEQGFAGIRATFENYPFLFEDGYYGIIYLASLKMAAIGTLLCLLLGYPMAYFIARQSPRRRQILLLAVMLPFWISFLLRVYAWIGLLGNRGIINRVPA